MKITDKRGLKPFGELTSGDTFEFVGEVFMKTAEFDLKGRKVNALSLKDATPCFFTDDDMVTPVTIEVTIR